MRPTVPFISAKFSEFNHLCFGDELPPIPVVLTRARTFLGKVCYRRRCGLFGIVKGNDSYQLRISVSFDLEEREWEDVVIHEMIHYYIAFHNIHDSSSHGPVFRRMMLSINSEYGRNVSVRHHGRSADPPRPTDKVRVLCVSELSDGNLGVTVCARTKVRELDRTLPRYYSLKSRSWYVTANPFFEKYPSSRTPKIYRITKPELDEHLKDAQQIQF